MGPSTRKAQSLDQAPPKVHREDPGIGGHLACVDAHPLLTGSFQDGSELCDHLNPTKLRMVLHILI